MMMTRIISRIILFVLTLNSSFAFDDPCTTYQELGSAEDYSRSVASNQFTENSCEDMSTDGWYRIPSKAGERMPTECIFGGWRCGAFSPIWMNGTFPEIGKINNVTGYVAEYNGNCFFESYDIQVKNCSAFLVYHLVPVSNCIQRYCFGKELPCPSGETSDNGFSPGCKYDPCLSVNYNELDQWQRSTGNQDTRNLCDNFLASGWYRPISPVGSIMPTQCPKDGFKCGTSNPIWMNGAYPSVGQTANVTACVSDQNGECCRQSYDMQVKNCNGYYVYNLTHTNGCYQAYCFGNESKCPVGETSDNGGFTPGCEFDPCHESNYAILFGEMKRSSNYTLQPGDTAIEDSRLHAGWYKIDSVTGNDIVNKPVKMMQCGTVYPLWIQGGTPSVAEKTADRKVCKSGLDGDCEEQYDIKIRNCGSYRTYYLNQLNVDKASYCFGTLPVPPSTTTTTRTSSTTTTIATSTTPTTTIATSTTPTTTTSKKRPHDNESKRGEDEDETDISIVIPIVLLSIICTILIGVMVVGCYKLKTAPSRADSFSQLDILIPPSYNEAVNQNSENDTRTHVHGQCENTTMINIILNESNSVKADCGKD